MIGKRRRGGKEIGGIGKREKGGKRRGGKEIGGIGKREMELELEIE